MTRPLPAPLPERSVLETPQPRIQVPLVTALEWATRLAPLLAEIRQRSPDRSSPRSVSPLSPFTVVESLRIELIEHVDGRREWQLEHVKMAAPRRRWLPGRWSLAFPLLGLLTVIVARVARSVAR
ncbi:hypothetical protein [Thermomicrobium sp.]|jgi:hypothetical protein|uniref:hypothetical protein n=1 Tax=Thermomicrobium sp. TaxID=1969469 RepID=UPI001B0EEC95|nr:hypothetical protein [Thermomicrobium sp.]MBO9305812.1 hypothetical protein [Thermomicrobium sp.]